ncbi:MAG: hypothetical protein ACK2T7_06050 [Anaerolineales bacterium]
MDFIKQRLPQKEDLINTALACILAANTWAILVFLHSFPSLSLQMYVNELIATLAYTLGGALTEAALIFIFLCGLAVLLPERFFKKDFSAKAILYLLVIYLLVIPYNWFPFKTQIPPLFPPLWILFCVLLIVYFHSKIEHSQRAVGFFDQIVERVPVLGYFYLGLDLFSWLFILFRII